MRIILSILGIFFKFLIPVFVLLGIILLNTFINIVLLLFKGYRFKKNEFKYFKKPSIFKRLLIYFPNRLAKDLIFREPNEFRDYGLHMFCGEQGSGKTISLVHFLLSKQKQYPKCKIHTNMNYKYQHGEIEHWKDIVKNENGIYGQIEVLDEIQTWFSSLQSKDFPLEMITEISQQRKQRKMIVGTAQVFSRIAKPIREQTTFVYLPMTIFGCLTIVRKTKPEFWDDEKQKFNKYIGTYFFVHDDNIRNSFDTYKKIEKYNNQGFKPDIDRSVLFERS